MKLRRIAERMSRIPGAAGFAAAIGLGTFVVAWPIWYFATRHKSAYTAAVLSAAACGVAVALIRKFRKRRERTP